MLEGNIITYKQKDCVENSKETDCEGCKKDIERKYLLLVLDFWEAEILGYDVIKKIDVSGTFYKLILKEIEARILEVFGEVFGYGVKTYIDGDKGLFYYEIKLYGERLDEFIIEEMLKNHSTIKFFLS